MSAKLQILKNVAIMLVLIVAGALYVKHRSVVSARFNEFQQISTWQITSIELYEYPPGSVSYTAYPTPNLGGRRLAVVTNYSEISKFSELTKSIRREDWNHFLDREDYRFKLQTTKGSFMFYGFQTGYLEDIWVSIGGNSGIFIPHLHQWIDEVSGQAPKTRRTF